MTVLQMTAVQPLAEPWKISLSVSQVLGKRSGAVGLEMRLQSEALPGYQSPIQGESNPSSAASVGCSAEGSEEANVRCYPKAGLCEPSEPNDAVLSWMYEHDGAADPSIRDSLDGFYKMYCRKQPERKDPTYEAASRCLSQKISELEQKDGTKYVSRCLQMAQLVLNRDGCKIFPNHPPSACFSKPAEGEVLLENRRSIPGLSDDILQFLLKHTQAECSPDGSHEK
ncbi:shieldin complex subunit 1 isoform X3 [Parus major]|uniref:shieldin complex subunit 1 isoform X3 n=1 Tax=Parus major TaxID=9157 RepID=UPI0007715B5D|nr:shieldin complex subunit 1 isoform X3 [Parus major]XP_033369105.1 shieldin complex subunit 1 isoform X3 [Parus major]